jgi:endonuclease YncB( thermonuclease family)
MWRAGVLVFLLSLPANAQIDDDTVRPSARPRFQVVSGGTVKFGPQVVRLFGVDAPEMTQACDDGQWHPGPLAKKALQDLIAGRPVTCRQVDHDPRTNRPVAQCYAGDDDLQALMVLAGWAWASRESTSRYVPEERDASTRKAGVHAHRCLPPWEWRAQAAKSIR